MTIKSSTILVHKQNTQPFPPVNRLPFLPLHPALHNWLFMAHLVLILLLLIVTAVPSVAKDFWNIDCGSDSGFESPVTNLTFEGDGNYARTGESRVVSNTSGLARELTTLRIFPKYTKNCYTIPDIEKGAKLLVTAWFYYGDYDGKQIPPKFWLLADGNLWSPIITSLDKYDLYKIVYVTKRNGTSICVAKDEEEDQIPFVSAIQVSRLKPTVYGYSDLDFNKYAFYLRDTLAFGTKANIVRYPDDAYDRIWHRQTNYAPVNNSAPFVSTAGKSDEPPEMIFRAAAEARDDKTNLTYRTTYLPSSPTQIYISMYFTEVLNTSSVRSFRLYQDGAEITTKPIVPSFGSAYWLRGVVNASNDTVFDLVRVTGSTLRPIISGLEVLQFSDEINNGTYSDDVDALRMLQTSYKVLQDWTGDPCLPSGYNWEWIKCNSDEPPRVTKLFLDGFGLSADLPDFSVLDALLTIDVHNNKLSGGIPEFLGNFPNLEVLNLADNDFSSIPTWLSRNTKILVNITGNPKLCNSGDFCFLPSLSEGPPSFPGDAPAPSPSRSSKFMVTRFSLCISILIVMLM